MFDSNTLELIINFYSVNKAMKYARVNFYTLKNLIDNGGGDPPLMMVKYIATQINYKKFL